MAYECQVPIIPVATYGIDRVFGKTMKIPASKGRVRVKFGTPIAFDKLIKMKEISPGETAPDYQRAAAKLQRIVHDLWADLWAEDQKTEQKKEETVVAKSP